MALPQPAVVPSLTSRNSSLPVPANVQQAALALWDGNATAARDFLERPHPLLEGRTPKEVACMSAAAANRVSLLIARADAGVSI